MTKLKILIVGGEDRNIPDDVRDALDFHHVEQSAKDLSKQACPDAKAIVLIARFTREQMAHAAKKLARSRKIPFVSAKTGNYILHELVKHKVLDKLPVKQPDPIPVTAESVPGRVDSEAAPTVADVAVAASPSPQASTGLSPEELWDKYGQKAIDTLQSALKPGEKIAEDDIVSLFQIEGGVGLPQQDAIELLPELIIRGIITNVKGKTWRLSSSVRMDDGEEVEEDAVEVETVLHEKSDNAYPMIAPKKKRVRSVEYWAKLLAGLPEGPYDSLNHIWSTARCCKEFTGTTGNPIVPSYSRKVIPVAIKLGIVTNEGGVIKVNSDPSIKLTKCDHEVTTRATPRRNTPPRGNTPPSGLQNTHEKGHNFAVKFCGLPDVSYRGRMNLWREALKYKEFSLPDGEPLSQVYGYDIVRLAVKNGYVTKEGAVYRIKCDPAVKLTLRDDAPQDLPSQPIIKEAYQQKKASSEAEMIDLVNKYFGGIIPTLDRYTIPTRVLKKMIPDKYWETLWCQCIARIVNIGHHDNAMPLKEKFSSMERDRMAYDVLAKLPIETIAPFLKDEAKDEEKTCSECDEKFVFTVGEQKFFQDKFGSDATSPKRCQKCRDKARRV